jgi:hypothetical protein
MRRAVAMSPGTGAARRRAAALRRRKLWGELPAVFSCTSGCYTLLRGLRTHLGVQGRGSGFYGGRRRKGAEPLLRRARGEGTGRDKEANWAGRLAYHTQAMRTGRRVERRRQQGGLVTEAARAALRRARGVAATGVEGVNLQAQELVKLLANLVIKRNRREAEPFTGGDETTAAAGTEAAALLELSSGSCACVLQRRKGSQGVRERAYKGPREGRRSG